VQTEGRRYHVLEAVGKGGFGTVYRAELVDAGGFTKSVALKVLNPELAENEDIAERLRDEARMLGLLRHRAVVKVDGMLLLNGRWTVIMEFIDGVDLKQLLSKGPVPAGCALEIVQEVAGALYAAFELPAQHGRPLKVLHRDIKPSNVQLTRTGEVKVLDFGVARAEFQHRESVTRSIFFGSLAYMAPERLDGIDTHAGDIYALGAVLFELILGEALGRTSGNKERHRRHIDDRLNVLHERCGHEDLCQLIADCLAYDGNDRPPARDLERRLRGLRAEFSEPWLADYAELTVPGLLAERESIDDDLSGSILVEQGSKPRVTGDPSFTAPHPMASQRPAAFDEDDEPGGIPWSAMLGTSAALIALVAVITLGGGGVTALWVATRGEDGQATVTEPDQVEVDGENAVDLLAGEPGGSSGASDGGNSTSDDPKNTGSTAATGGSAATGAAASGSTQSGSTATTTSSSSGGSESGGASGSASSGSASSGSASSGSASSGSASSGSASSGSTSPDIEVLDDHPWVDGGSEDPQGTVTETEVVTPDSSNAGQLGTVIVTGDTASVRLVGEGGAYTAGAVPVGTYRIEASFSGQPTVENAGSVFVRAGQRVTLTCKASLKRCIARSN